MSKVELASAIINQCTILNAGCYLFGGAVRDFVAADFDKSKWDFNDLDIFVENFNAAKFRAFVEIVRNTMLYWKNDFSFKFDYIESRGIPYGFYGTRLLFMRSMRDLFGPPDMNIFQVDFVTDSEITFSEDVDINCLAINCGNFNNKQVLGAKKIDRNISKGNIDTVIENIKNKKFNPVVDGMQAKASRIMKIKSKGYSNLNDIDTSLSISIPKFSIIAPKKEEKVCVCNRKNDIDANECWYCGRLV